MQKFRKTPYINLPYFGPNWSQKLQNKIIVKKKNHLREISFLSNLELQLLNFTTNKN